MARIRKVPKGVIHPGVCSGGREGKYKSARQNQGGGAETKGVGVSHRPFRPLTRHHSEKNHHLTRDVSSDEAKKRDISPLLEGAKKYMTVESEYNHFTISPFHHCNLCTTAPYLFDNFTIMI